MRSSRMLRPAARDPARRTSPRSGRQHKARGERSEPRAREPNNNKPAKRPAALVYEWPMFERQIFIKGCRPLRGL